MRTSPLYSSSRHRAAAPSSTDAAARPGRAGAPPARARAHAGRAARTTAARPVRHSARAGGDADLRRPAACAARAHAGGHRRGGTAHDGDANAAVAGVEGVREASRIGRARARSRGHRGQQRGRDRCRYRRRDARQGRHPHQPPRRARREEDRRRIRRRPRIRGDGHRHAARARPRRAAGEDDSRRPPGGDDAVDARSDAGRPGDRRGVPVRHRPVGLATASSPDCGASTGRPKASAC